MTTQLGTAAPLDGRHDLELAKTEVACLNTTPSRPVGGEDIRDLQRLPRHGCGLGGRLQPQIVQWAFDLAQCPGGDLAIERGRLELLVSEQHLDHTDVYLVLQKMGCKAVATMSLTT